MLCDFYAERAERRNGNIYIRSALDGRKDLYHAVAVKQRKRKQKPRYELAADIAAQNILTCRERAGKFDPTAVFLISMPLPPRSCSYIPTPLFQAAGVYPRTALCRR